ncbi:MAG: aspartate--tRNA(Asn) ligase, partial [Clostridia bacterium]|nr:aspartate--tRNA(Asn) ligase [Clostridia bacterium]
MTRKLISEIKPDEVVKISGFVENCRNKRTMAFIIVRDISSKMQITVDKEANPHLAEVVDKITLDSVITVVGKVVENSYVKLNGMEILPDEITIESVAEPFPIQDDASIDLKMDYRWLDLRSERNRLIFQVQTLIAASFRNFLLEKGFIEIHSPKIIGTASESGSDVFEVKYFDDKAYLAQSPQFYKQMAMASGFERIFEVGPVFRAEKSYTNKHATEFTGFDLELSYIDSYEDVMKLEEEMLYDMIKRVSEKYGEDIKRLFDVELVVPTLPFPRMTLKNVYDELEKRYNFTVPESEKGDLTTEAERMCEQLMKEMYNHEFVFITDFSAEKRAFYHMRDEKGMPLGYDLVWKGVEITTGAQREHRYDILKKQAEEKGLEKDVENYLKFFQYGCPPHGGFGIGLDRITMRVL